MSESVVQRSSYREYNSCLRKTRFHNKRAADNQAQQLRRAAHARRSQYVLRAYHCGICGGWHIGHDERKFKG